MEIYYKSGVITFMLAQASEYRWMEWQGNYIQMGLELFLKIWFFVKIQSNLI